MTDLLEPLVLAALAFWALCQILQTGLERTALAAVAQDGPTNWRAAMAMVSHPRHLLRRLTLRQWRGLYPHRMVETAELWLVDPASARLASASEALAEKLDQTNTAPRPAAQEAAE